MKRILALLAQPWDLMRIIRLAFAILAGVQCVQQPDIMVGLISLFFFYQAIANTGCCGRSCALPPPRTKNDMEQV